MQVGKQAVLTLFLVMLTGRLSLMNRMAMSLRRRASEALKSG